MIKKALIVFLAFICLQTSLFAHDQFISIKNKSTFNLPQLGISVAIPAYTGFTVPLFSGKEVYLNINDKTYYFLNLEYFDTPKYRTFKFQAQKSEENMLLNIMPIDPEKITKDVLMENVKRNPNVEKITAPLNTKIGKTIAYVAKGYTVHSILHGNYCFVFTFKSSTAKKDLAVYESIIKSAEAKDFSLEMSDYQNRINSGYFDHEAKAPKDVDSRYKYDMKTGTFTQPTTLSFQEIDIEVALPENTVYGFTSRNIEHEVDGKRAVKIYKIDLDEKLNYMAFFNIQGVSFSARATAYETLATAFSPKDAEVYERKKINLDGVQATVEIGRSKMYADLNIVAKLDGLDYIFTIYGIFADNIALVDDIVSSIKLPRKSPRIMQVTDSKPISSLLKLEKADKPKLNKITISQVDRNKHSEVFECRLTEAGIRFEVPGKMDSYLIRPDENFKQVNSKLCTLSGLPRFCQGWFGVTSASFIAAIDVVTYPDTDTWLRKMYHGYNSGPYCKPTEISLLTINDIEWGVLTGKLKDGSFRRIMSFIDPQFSFQFIVEASSIKELDDKSSFIHTFKRL